MRAMGNAVTVFGILGQPVQHSLSPAMHNAAFAYAGLPYRYFPFEVMPDRLHTAVAAIVALGLGGVNVTLPHKEAVVPMLDRVENGAARIGAVNTIEVSDGRLIGHNTDGEGFLRALADEAIHPEGMRVIMLGAGGAALGVTDALLSRGVAQMIVFSRTAARTAHLVNRMRQIHPDARISVGLGDAASAASSDTMPTLLINATPLGLAADDSLPFPEARLGPGWVVADLVYRPRETPLLRVARQRGAIPVSGVGMLLHQGALAFEIWTKRAAPVAVMRAALQVALGAA